MPEGFRFRTNWRGRLILQVSYKYAPSPYYRYDTAIGWRDASAEDLNDFYNPTVPQQPPKKP